MGNFGFVELLLAASLIIVSLRFVGAWLRRREQHGAKPFHEKQRGETVTPQAQPQHAAIPWWLAPLFIVPALEDVRNEYRRRICAAQEEGNKLLVQLKAQRKLRADILAGKVAGEEDPATATTRTAAELANGRPEPLRQMIEQAVEAGVEAALKKTMPILLGVLRDAIQNLRDDELAARRRRAPMRAQAKERQPAPEDLVETDSVRARLREARATENSEE